MMRMRRSGFTLNEVVISLVILSVIGMAVTRILTYQSRYFAHETNLRSARSVARAATNILVSDLRTVQDSGGVDSVTADGKLIRILVPYRFGLLCGTQGKTNIVSMLPIDSATIAMSVYKGFAWRDATGRYIYIFPTNPTTADLPTTSGSPATCTGSGGGQAQISTVSAGGRTGQILDLKSHTPTGATTGAPVFLFQKITYSFRTSGVYPSALGLWRNVEGGINEELVAPFDTAARFRFYKPGDDTSTVAPPTLAEIRGVQLVLTALSPRAVSNKMPNSIQKVVTSVFFKNVRAY